jgi:ABC-type sugar transport system permease subunit
MAYLFVLPALTLYALFQGYPIVRGLVIAFSDYRYLVPNWAPFTGLQNWSLMAADGAFWNSLGRSAYFTLLYMPSIVAIGLVAALLISRYHHPVEASVYRVIAYLPVVLPIAVALLLWRQLLNSQFGYVNYLLRDVAGLPAPNWLGDARWIIPTLAIASVWKHVGQPTLLFLIGLYGINSELYEAAQIDGAGRWQLLWSITLPLLRPTLVLVFVLSAGVLGTVEESLVFFPTDYGSQNAALLVGRYAYDTAFRLGDMRWGYAAAINLTVGVISMVFSALVFRLLRGDRAD